MVFVYTGQSQKNNLQMNTKHPDIPKELVWDYKEPPMELLWRLQRIADFFPVFGTDRKTVELLFDHLGSLQLEEGKSRLIAMYREVWNEKGRESD